MLSRLLRVFTTLLFVLSLSPLCAMAEVTVFDFENLTDGENLTNQLPGLTFSNALVASAGISLNDVDFPPFSGVNAITDIGGPISINFASPLSSVGAYFTYGKPLTLNAYAGGSFIGSLSSPFSANYVSGGDIGSSPNSFLSINGNGITLLTISGNSGGGSFVMDNLTVTSVPEPSEATFLLVGVPFLWARLKWQRSKASSQA